MAVKMSATTYALGLAPRLPLSWQRTRRRLVRLRMEQMQTLLRPGRCAGPQVETVMAREIGVQDLRQSEDGHDCHLGL